MCIRDSFRQLGDDGGNPLGLSLSGVDNGRDVMTGSNGVNTISEQELLGNHRDSSRISITLTALVEEHTRYYRQLGGNEFGSNIVGGENARVDILKVTCLCTKPNGVGILLHNVSIEGSMILNNKRVIEGNQSTVG
eukprot:TRINITY_DN37000_c0_g1_i1.p2 TRINITY_DN37000_c0_g1~~TRINITY_DN37000_c0_g1_i1.p2  ORF type:complete len:136 (+),score=16.27 TRINITY_DN37000_c0_g1_i1:58-465(+)